MGRGLFGRELVHPEREVWGDWRTMIVNDAECQRWEVQPVIAVNLILQEVYTYIYIGEFFQGGFLGMKVVTFFATLRADLEDFFKCRR